MEVINNNAEAIIQYFPLIEDGTLQQLQEVQQQLEIVRTSTSYQSVGSFFQRGIPEDTSGPQLIDVWFGGREIPTYLQG
jgi:predicted DNA-binding transcriptional regulator